MNHLFDTKRLYNRYLVMRHGHSIANLEGIIVSHIENGGSGYGLSEQGHRQVGEAVRLDTQLDTKTIIVSSDFKRAIESAEIAHRLLSCELPVCFDMRLRERDFGELELTPDSNYIQVWREDEQNPNSRPGAAESANQVMERVTALIIEYEKKISGATLLIVSHGDALQILQTAFCKQDATTHRQKKHLETAEIRRLTLRHEADHG